MSASTGPEAERLRPPAALDDEQDARFVFDLVVPPVGAVDADQVVKIVLHLLAQRQRSDDADVDFDRIERLQRYAGK